jgi:tRNA threonylcarbamoyladenosine biosynthesis protein TsaB
VSTILCIDTASDRFALALDRDGAVTSFETDAAQDHSRLLLPAIKQLLAGDEPEAVLVVTGPGAYAGIRVGIATAQGLALAKTLPLYGIGTLEAAALASGQRSVTVVHPAGRGEFAVQRFENGMAQGEPRIAPPESLLATGVVGEGASRLLGIEIGARERAVAALNDRARKIRKGAIEPGAEAFYLREPNITLSRRQRAAAP